MLFDVDVVGGLNIKKHYGHRALAIFVQPPSIEALKQRLQGRNTDTEEMIGKRVAKAEWENQFAPQFDIVIVHDNLELAQKETVAAIKEFLNT